MINGQGCSLGILTEGGAGGRSECSNTGKRRPAKRSLALPDLEQTKSAVLNNLTSKSGQRTYDHAINEFVDWYCSEPRLAFNRTGLLSPELAAGIRRVKGVRRIGARLGNWLTADQGRSLLLNSYGDSLSSKRNCAILALLIGCGLRRGELLAISAASVQLREDHWVIVPYLRLFQHAPVWVFLQLAALAVDGRLGAE